MTDNTNEISVTIDSNPITYKPILFTTYDTISKYILNITYEDSTTKTVELVENDKDRPYRIVFKREGKLITATGVPRVIREINECSSFCDFANRIMDSNDLLIELDCSSEYQCTKVRFYLKDIRDIRDLVNEPLEGEEEPVDSNHTMYPIYLNGLSCMDKITCIVDEELNTTLYSQITKMGEVLSRDQYSDFTVFTTNPDIIITPIEPEDGDVEDKVSLKVPEELIDTEIKIIIRYFINEMNHPVFDEFTIIPTNKVEEIEPGTYKVLTRAVTTQDTQYLGDGLKPALGVGLTPGYKQYRNKSSYDDSVLE